MRYRGFGVSRRPRRPQPIGGLDGWHLHAESICRRRLEDADKTQLYELWVHHAHRVAAGDMLLVYDATTKDWRVEE